MKKYSFSALWLLFILVIFIHNNSFSNTYSVTTSSDDTLNVPDGSLRKAIKDANLNNGRDTIVFKLGKLPAFIDLIARLPEIKDTLYINGRNESRPFIKSGISLKPSVNNLSSKDIGLFFVQGSEESHVSGLHFEGFNFAGIFINQSNGIEITHNTFGIDITGNTNPASTLDQFGIYVENSKKVKIGGEYGKGSNLISKCGRHGIVFSNVDSSYIIGNIIGTDISGTIDMGNFNSGIRFIRASDNNNIGIKGEPNTGNLISGNFYGIYFDETSSFGVPSSNQNIIAHNKIGVQSDSKSQLQNNYGIYISGRFSGNELYKNIFGHNQYGGYYSNNSSGNPNLLKQNKFFCNGNGGIRLYNSFFSSPKQSPYVSSVTDTSIKGIAKEGDVIELYYTDTVCNNTQGIEYFDKVITDENGKWEYKGELKQKRFVTATATENNYRTSSFSNTLCITQQPETGRDQFIFENSATMEANMLDTAHWYSIDTLDEVFSQPDNPNTKVENLEPGTHYFVWWNTQTECPAYDTVKVTYLENIPAAPDAGKDTLLCGSTTLTVTGNHVPPTYKSEKWEALNNSIELSDPDYYKTKVKNLPKGKHKLIYTWEHTDPAKSLSDTILVEVVNPLTVTTNKDSVCGSLRKAISFANQNPGYDTITFSKEIDTIVVRTALPDIMDPVFINGNSHPDYVDKPVVKIFGDTSGIDLNENQFPGNGNVIINSKSSFPAFTFSSNYSMGTSSEGSVLSGLNIALFNNPVRVSRNNIIVKDNYLGIIDEGAFYNSYAGPGINIYADSAIILNNVIGGSEGYGIVINGKGNLIKNNFIGITPLNEYPVINRDGILIDRRNNLVVKNTIANNSNTAITVSYGCGDSECRKIIENKISKNRIFCNGGKGILLKKGSENDVPGNFSHPKPVIENFSATSISGNALPGDSVELFYADTICNKLQGKDYIATIAVDENGLWQYNGDLVSNKIVATSTDSAGNTSEFSLNPCILNAGENDTIYSDFYKLNAKSGNGIWTNLTNKGLIVNDSLSKTYVVGLQKGTYQFEYSSDYNACPSSDTVTIIVDSIEAKNPLTAPDTTICGKDSILLKGETPFMHTSSWTSLTQGVTIENTFSDTTMAKNLKEGLNIFIYKWLPYYTSEDTLENVFLVQVSNDPTMVTTKKYNICGSIDQALDYANLNPGPDTIRFSYLLKGDKIPVSSSYPLIFSDDSTMIDGDLNNDCKPDISFYDPDGKMNNNTAFILTGSENIIKSVHFQDIGTGIKIDGNKNKVICSFFGTDRNGHAFSATPNLFTGIDILENASYNIIGNNTKNGNIFTGYENAIITGKSPSLNNITGKGRGNVISGNKIGIDINDNFISGTNGTGIQLFKPSNKIGNNVNGSSNIISGNNTGIKIEADSAIVINNFIGTGAFGENTKPNKNGILVHKNENIINENVVSGNSFSGITVHGNNNVIEKNIIGLDSSKKSPVPNFTGILLGSSKTYGEAFHNHIINNTIAGNKGFGIKDSLGENNNIIKNKIGESGKDFLNKKGGVLLIGSSQDTLFENVIAFNNGNGIELLNQRDINNIIIDTCLRNTFFKNAIYANKENGIKFNDEEIQNKILPPAINKISYDTIYGTANNNALVQIFADSANEGQFYIDSVYADENGKWQYIVDYNIIPSGLNFFTAIQTKAGNSSEFSDPAKQEFIVNAGPDIKVCVDSAVINAEPVLESATGNWKVESGNAFILNPDSSNSLVKDISKGVNQLLWIVEDKKGNVFYDTLNIIYSELTEAEIYDHQINLCDKKGQLAASEPTVKENVKWYSNTSGVTFSDSTDYFTSISYNDKEIFEIFYQITNETSSCISKDTLLIKGKGILNSENEIFKRELPNYTHDFNIKLDTNRFGINEKIRVEIKNSPESGLIDINEDTTQINYTPFKGKTGSDYFSYTICDLPCNICDTIDVDIEILNREPFANNKDTIKSENTLTILLSELTEDYDDNIISYEILSMQPQISYELNRDTLIILFENNGAINSDSVIVNYKVTDSNGDFSTGILRIYFEEPPSDNSSKGEITVFNAVSPNNDGIHDYFEIDNIEDYGSTKVIIFNRWGNKVYINDNYENNSANGFTGKNNKGNFLPDGTYYYHIEVEGYNKDIKPGYLQLIK